jgi:NADH dehydrogenase
VEQFYHNIDKKNVRVIIVHSGNRLLPEMTEGLAEFALKKLLKNGVEVILNSRVLGATENSATLKNGEGVDIPTRTIIWSGGVAPSSLVSILECERNSRNGRIVVDKHLDLPKFKGVYALGDCFFITDPRTGSPYPPTPQHAVREAAVVSKNIVADIEGKIDEKVVFDYKTKSLMASIGKHVGVGNLLGIPVHGFLAWWIWHTYYLANLPTLHKKITVLADWITDIFFRRDVTMFRTLAEQKQGF